MHPAPPIRKTLTIVNEHINTCHTKIRTVLSETTDEPVYWICKRSNGSKKLPRIKIRANTRDKASIAGVRCPSSGRAFRAIVARHPDEVPKANSTEVESEYFKDRSHFLGDLFGGGTEWTFEVDGRDYTWRPTKSKRLGASTCSGDNFKLLDSRKRTLAVFIHDWRWSKIGRLDYFVELEEELEVMSLAVLCGLNEKVKQWDREKEERDKLWNAASARDAPNFYSYPHYVYSPYY